MPTDRRAFIRQGSLWLLGTTVIAPDVLERLAWRRRFWPSAYLVDPEHERMVERVLVEGFDPGAVALKRSFAERFPDRPDWCPDDNRLSLARRWYRVSMLTANMPPEYWRDRGEPSAEAKSHALVGRIIACGGLVERQLRMSHAGGHDVSPHA